MQEKYLPACRRGAPGLLSMTDGLELYAYLIRQHTTSELSADQIHQLGLQEVERIRDAMEAIRTEVGFTGDLSEFFEHLRDAPRFRFASKEALVEAYREVWRRVEPELPRLFSTLPQGAFEIRPVPDFLEQTAGGAITYRERPMVLGPECSTPTPTTWPRAPTRP